MTITSEQDRKLRQIEELHELIGDRPIEVGVERFNVDVPNAGIGLNEDQFRVVVKLARFEGYGDARRAATQIVTALRGKPADYL